MLCIYLSLFFTSPGLSFCQKHLPFLVLLRYAALHFHSFVLPLLQQELTHSLHALYCLLFYSLVSTAILRYRGYIVLYSWVRSAAEYSPTGSLSQSHTTTFQKIPQKLHNISEQWNTCRMNREWKLQHKNIHRLSITSCHICYTLIIVQKIKTTPFYSLVSVFAGPSMVILQSVWGCGQAASIMVPQPACAAAVPWNRHGASIITSIITATQHRATETRTMRIEGAHNVTYEI